MARDWKSIAAATTPGIPAEQLAKITPSLEALDSAFQPLLAKLTLEAEPAYILLVAREKDA
jgi:hypothetical protein